MASYGPQQPQAPPPVSGAAPSRTSGGSGTSGMLPRWGMGGDPFFDAQRFFGNPQFAYNYHRNNQLQMFNNQRQRVENIMRQMEAGDERARLHIQTEGQRSQGQSAVANILQELARNRSQFTGTEFDIERTQLLDELRLRQQLTDLARTNASLNPLSVPTRARELLGR